VNKSDTFPSLIPSFPVRILKDPQSGKWEARHTVTQYDINSNTIATVENAALVAVDANGNQFIVEANQSLLGNIQSGQTFTAKVKVLGAVGVQSTTGGGTGEAPDFDASTFTVTG
jgi:hypothetical protein